MTIEELQAENEALKRQLFEATTMNGMLDAQIQKLREDVRVLTHLNESAQAQLEDARNQARGLSRDKDHWFGFKSADGTRRASFDMLMVSAWSASFSTRGKWSAEVHVGVARFTLDDEQTKEFWTKFEKYLNRE